MKLISAAFLFLLSFALYAQERQVPSKVSSGAITSIKNFPSEHITPRNVHIWLPDNYDSTKKYPVLYMHDGHMLFDPSITWNQQEWGVDEVAGKLIKTGQVRPFIVVGVDSLDDTRYVEYFPAKAQNYISTVAEPVPDAYKELEYLSDQYLQFLVEELKPYIDKNYSVSTKAEDTAIMGSSMGGLISMYAISEYPKVFGMAACVSTHFPGWNPGEKNGIGDTIIAYMGANFPKAGEHKVYFDFGTEEIDAHYEAYQVKADVLLRAKGFTESDWMTYKDEGAGHNEKAWNARLHLPLTFMFKTQ